MGGRGQGRHGDGPSRTGSPCQLVTPLLERNLPKQASLPWGCQEPTLELRARAPCPRREGTGAALKETSTVHQQSGEQRLLPAPSGSPTSHRHELHHLLHWGSPVQLVGSAAPPGTHTSVGRAPCHVVTPQLPLGGWLMRAESGPAPPTVCPSGVSAPEPLGRPLTRVSLSISQSLSRHDF